MRNVIKNTISPLLSISCLMLGASFFVSVISLRMKWAGYTEAVIGYVHTAYYAGMLLGAIKVERPIHRIGHIRAFAAFTSIFTASILIQATNDSIVTWILLRFAAGFSLAGLCVVVESWLLDKSTQQTRGRILSIYMIAYYLPQAISQLFLDYVDLITLQSFIIASIFAVLAVVPVTWTRSKSPEISEPHIHNIGVVFRASPFGFMGALTAGLVQSAIYSFGPNFAEEYNLSYAYTMSLVIAGGVILQWPVGKISDHFDRRRVLVLLSFLMVPLSLMIAFFPTEQNIVYPSIFILGGLAFTLYPLCIAQMSDRFDDKSFTSIASVLLVAFGLGAMFGPFVAPYFMNIFGLYGLFIYSAFFSVILVVIGLVTMLVRKPVPQDERGEYAPLPGTTPIAYDMDPRAEPIDEEK